MTEPNFVDSRQKRIAREAADWHARMADPASEGEVEAFEAWLAADHAHVQAYAEMESLSALSARLPRRLLAARSSASQRAWLRPAFATAAAILLIVASALFLTGQGRQAAYASVSNPGPAVRDYRLADGTIVVLNPGARIAVAIASTERKVTVEAGRARFTVARDKRPFVIRAARARLLIRAATVDVSLDGQAVEISVLEGQVALKTDDAADAGIERSLLQGVAVRLDGRDMRTVPVDRLAARWPEARVGFDDVPLASVIARANRGGTPTIALQDGEIGKLRVTGVLDLRDPRSLARKLAATLDLRAEERADAIFLIRPDAVSE